MASNMSQPLKRTKKGAKMGSATLTPEGDELPGSSKSAPIISNSANRNDNPEATASRRSSGSSDGSDNDSPRSMVQGIITVIGERVQTQLSSFLSNEISSLLATVRAEITQEFTKEVQKLKQEHESQIVILKEQLEAQKKTQQKQDEWMALEPKLMDEMTKKQNEYLVLNVGGIEYATSRSTMLKYPNSMLGAMFSGRYGNLLDPQGRHFIDRDGPLFRHILNFLRTESISTVDVTNITALNELHQEAVFYQLEPLIQLLQVFIARVDEEEVSNLQEYRGRIRANDEKAPSRTTKSNGPLHLPLAFPSSSNRSDVYFNPEAAYINTNASNQRLLRRVSTMATQRSGRRSGTREPPEYTREEIHNLKVRHQFYPDARLVKLNLAGLDLRGLDLSKLDVRGIDFSRCNLEDASFERALIEGCDFSEANLTRANFQQADVGQHENFSPDFTDAILSGADFSRYTGVLIRRNFEGVEDGMVGLELRWLR